jgi:uncharacterized protein YggE
MDKGKHQTDGSLSVSGEGEVKAKPDVAIIEVGVLTTSKSAREAIADNAKQMSDLVKRIKQMEVPEEDLQTVGFSVSPIINYDKDSPDYGKVVRYQVENTLSVRIEPARAGAVLDEAAAAGANQVRQVTFGLRNDAAQREQALEAAVRAAMRKAELVTKTMGIALLGPTSINVSYGGRFFFRAEAMRSDAAATTPVESGVLTVSASASVNYAVSSRR